MLVSAGDVVEQIQALTGGFGVDVAIDAVGRPETWKQAFYGRDLAGTVVLVGVPTPTMTLDMPLLDFFGRGGSLKSSWYGDCLPSRDFPVLSELFLQGRLPLDKFVSERIAITDIESAFEKCTAARYCGPSWCCSARLTIPSAAHARSDLVGWMKTSPTSRTCLRWGRASPMEHIATRMGSKLRLESIKANAEFADRAILPGSNSQAGYSWLDLKAVWKSSGFRWQSHNMGES